MVLVIDARSVASAVTAPVLRAPAECSTLVGVAWLREKLKKTEVDNLYWADTRIMIADGLTKGAVGRSTLHDAMNGWWNILAALVDHTLSRI